MLNINFSFGHNNIKLVRLEDSLEIPKKDYIKIKENRFLYYLVKTSLLDDNKKKSSAAASYLNTYIRKAPKDALYQLVDNSYFIYDDEKNSLVPGNVQMQRGFIYKEDEGLIEGLFQYNFFTTVHLLKDKKQSTISFNSLYSMKMYCKLHNIPSVYPCKFGNYFVIKKEDAGNPQFYRQQSPYVGYEADSTNPMFTEVVERYNTYKENNLKASKNSERIFKLLGGKSLGLEYEVAQGNLNSALLSKLGLVPVIDGSINREYFSEYPTVPLKDARDYQSIQLQCEALQYACNINQNCAFHLHVGGIKRDHLTRVALFALAQRIQDEMFSIVHPYKKDEINTLGKAKNYSGLFPDLNLECFSDLIKEDPYNIKQPSQLIHSLFTTLGEESDNMETLKPWNRKWHCPTRYYWFNMVNYVLNKDSTIENRLLNPTFHFNEIFPWIIITVCLIRYAETFPYKVVQYKEKIRLKDILENICTSFGDKNTVEEVEFYTELYSDILKWIDYRKRRYLNVVLQTNKSLVGGNTARYPQEIGRNAINELNNVHNSKYKAELKIDFYKYIT